VTIILRIETEETLREKTRGTETKAITKRMIPFRCLAKLSQQEGRQAFLHVIFLHKVSVFIAASLLV